MASAATPTYSRVTLVGPSRRVDVVLPATEPVGVLLPDLLRLVDDSVASPPRLRELVTTVGEVLPTESSLAEAGIEDGAVLRLVAREDLPPAPVVHDVIEEVASDLDGRAWRWGPAARRWTATAWLVGLFLLAGYLLRGSLDAATAGWMLAGTAVVVCAAGAAVVRWGREPAGTALLLGGGAVGVLAAATAAAPAAARWGGAAAVACLVVGALGAATPLGRGGLIGGGLGLALVAGWVVGSWAGLAPDRLAAVQACVAVLLLGIFPRVALSASGLTALDDRRAAGERVARASVSAALAAAHRGLVVATVAVSCSAALAGYLLANAPTAWTVPLAVLLGVVLLNRARAYPLVGEVAALLLAAGAVLLALATGWARAGPATPWTPVVAVAAALVVPVLMLGVDFPEHLRARLRRLGDRLEGLAVMAMTPLTLGVFGTYGRLLDTF
ncbi:type VII secretion integral membrane protein EccD [Carbonactinospora thermoautotrophica]|uniref:type VII secretion integral membrane protein EccD n=1 Tax=Carbonactinospora thermoautotrophica TaxID=1469144 RepID=UPI00227213BE|nr:type VII secretion integral membrane protein EccD [Carbonactinospora thermoautotrophica]MCX9193767.1 type VII secretion integral membrane protein EccD [Carbonactinospora thermoautotrophica]